MAKPLVFLRGFTERRWLVVIVALLLLWAVAIPLVRRSERRPLSELAPDGVLAYVEVDDPVGLLDQLSHTEAWSQLAPLLGWPRELDGLGPMRRVVSLGHLSQRTLEVLWTARAALVVTGIEVNGSAVKLELAVVLQSHSGRLEPWIGTLVRDTFERGYGAWREEQVDISGHNGHIVESRRGSHRVIWCVINHLAIIANSLRSARRVVETYEGRHSALAGNRRFQQLRAAGSPTAKLFGYMSTQGLGTGTEESSWPTREESTPVGLLGHALKVFLSVFRFSLGYQMEVKDGLLVERYRILGEPDLMRRLDEVGFGPEAGLDSLQFIPQTSESFTILRLGHLDQLLSDLDAGLRRRLSTVSSVAFDEVLIGAKEAFGLDPEDTIADTLGGEIALVEGDAPDLLFVVQVTRRAKLATLVGKYLRSGGASVRNSQYAGVALFSSTDETRESFCFIGDTMLMGPEDLIRWALQAHQQGSTVDHAPAVMTLLNNVPLRAVEISIRLDHSDEAVRLATALQQLTTTSPDRATLADRIKSFSPTIRTTWLSTEGMISETRSPLGDLPLFFLGGETAAMAP